MLATVLDLQVQGLVLLYHRPLVATGHRRLTADLLVAGRQNLTEIKKGSTITKFSDSNNHLLPTTTARSESI
jgi:hypothetical protein